ncbi:MAG: nucleotide exchange factor GrpE [Candidatus Omnitrophica bacterium]|nr:nucleotide exchange factor GrpE [Candidatus Omnitrophota bacterium]MDD5437047.1 nucleotide exchange factor GrpE [Candidatus Omnitrophota bacterium]
MDNKETKNNKEAKNNNKEADSVTLARKDYDALKAKADERDAYCDKYLRAQAEFENARKRMEKDKLDYARFASDSLILEFFPILDSLEIAEKHIKEAKDFKAVQEGVDMIQLQIQKFLKDIGIERIKTEGAKFDPHLHEPIEAVEAPDKEEGDILAELKTGYKLNGRLLRPASVRIAKKKT